MELRAKWIENRVPPSVIDKVQSSIEDFLISHFDNAQRAYEMKRDFLIQDSPPRHPWNIGLIKAIDIATRDLSPTIKRDFHLKVDFLQG